MKKNKGFSLIELMIVVAIIGILSLIVFPFYNNYMFKVRVTEVINNLTPIMTNAQISSLSGSGGIDFNEIAKTDSDHGEYCITGTGQLYGMMNIANDKLGYLGINPEFVDYISIQGMTDKKCNNNAMDLTGNDILRIDIYFNSKFTNIGSTNRWENSIALLIPSENPDNNYNSNNYKNQNKQYNDSVSRVFCGVQTLSILVDKLPYVCKQYIITSADEGRLGSDVHDIKDYL